MMPQSLSRVLLEREGLRGRIAAQRGDVRRYASGLAGPAAVVDGARASVRFLRAHLRFLRAHPHVVVAGLGMAFVLRARTMLRLVTRALGIWRLARRARLLLRSLGY